MTVNLTDAGDLGKLVQTVLDGEEITICRDGEPVVDLVPTRSVRPKPRRFGTMKDKIIIRDPNWHVGPQTDEELEAWLKGEFE